MNGASTSPFSGLMTKLFAIFVNKYFGKNMSLSFLKEILKLYIASFSNKLEIRLPS